MASQVCHARSLVVWANTFLRPDDNGRSNNRIKPVDSISEFTSGNLLVPIIKAVTGHDKNDDTDSLEVGDSSSGGWNQVISLMQPAGLLKDAEVVEISSLCCDDGDDYGDDEITELPNRSSNPRTKMAVACLETLLRHTVSEQCAGRESFIRQIMSLDEPTQCTLSRIIVGGAASAEEDEEAFSSSSEAEEDDSPSKTSVISENDRFAPGLHADPTRRRSSLGASSSPCSRRRSYLNTRNLFSPKDKDDEQEISRGPGSAAAKAPETPARPGGSERLGGFGSSGRSDQDTAGSASAVVSGSFSADEKVCVGLFVSDVDVVR